MLALWLIGQQKVVDQLLTPFDDALDDMQRQHAQRVQDVQTLVKELEVALLVLATYWLHSQILQLHVLLVCLFEHLLQLHNLRDAALSGDDSSDCVLNWRLFLLQILDLFDDDRRVLVRLEPIYAVQEDSAVVVWDQVGLPGGQEFILQVVDNISLYGFLSNLVLLSILLEILGHLALHLVC